MPVQQKKKFINLLPQGKFEETTTGRVLKWTLSTFRFLVIAVELLVIGGFITRFWMDIEHSDLNDEIKQKSQLIESYRPFEVDFKTVQAKLLLFSLTDEQTSQNSELLQSLATKMPNGVNLTEFTRDTNLINVSVESVSELAIAQFMSNLRSSSDFSDLQIIRVQSQEDNPYITYTFQKNINQKPKGEENGI